VRWLEKLSEFDFTMKYVTGEENVLPDALLHLYEYDEPGTIQAPREYLQFDASIETTTTPEQSALSTPLLVGVEALTMSPRRSSQLQQAESMELPPPVPPTPPMDASAVTVLATVARLALPAGWATARPQPHTPCIQPPPLPAEMRCPKTGAEFAA